MLKNGYDDWQKTLPYDGLSSTWRCVRCAVLREWNSLYIKTIMWNRVMAVIDLLNKVRVITCHDCVEPRKIYGNHSNMTSSFENSDKLFQKWETRLNFFRNETCGIAMFAISVGFCTRPHCERRKKLWAFVLVHSAERSATVTAKKSWLLCRLSHSTSR